MKIRTKGKTNREDDLQMMRKFRNSYTAKALVLWTGGMSLVLGSGFLVG